MLQKAPIGSYRPQRDSHHLNQVALKLPSAEKPYLGWLSKVRIAVSYAALISLDLVSANARKSSPESPVAELGQALCQASVASQFVDFR